MVSATGFDDADDGCDFFSGFFASYVQPVLSTEGDGTDGVFTPVVVDLYLPMLCVYLDVGPLGQCVVTGFTHSAGWEDLFSDLDDAFFKCAEDGNRLLLSEFLTGFG